MFSIVDIAEETMSRGGVDNEVSKGLSARGNSERTMCVLEITP